MPFAILGFIILIGLSGGVMSTQSPAISSQQTLATSSVASAKPATAKTQVSATTYRNRTTASITKSNTTQVALDTRLPRARTDTTQNVEYNKALLRGSVNMYAQTKGKVFFVYGYNEKKVNALSNQYKTFAAIPKFTTAEVKVVSVATNAKGDNDYSRTISGLVDDTYYYATICVESSATARFSCGIVTAFKTPVRDPRSNTFRKPTASTDTATAINAYDATIKGRYNVNDADTATAFFVYGESNTEVTNVATEATSYSDVRENDELLQKMRLATGLKGTGEYVRVIDDLERGTKYFYRMCLEYDGDNEGLVCGSVRYFTTDARDRSDIPSVTMPSVQILGTKAVFNSSIRMNDFLDGRVFLLYGTDQARLAKITDTISFNRISQSRDLLQKVSIDSDFDGSGKVQKTISGLLPSTQYFYKVCAEYEAENDRNVKTLYLSCSATGTYLTGIQLQ